MSGASDHELISRVANRDREAFAALYDRLAGRAFGLILKVLRNRTDAEDVLQEAFLQVWNQADRFDADRAAPDVWVFLIARSRAVDRLRRRTLTTDDIPEIATFHDPGDDLARCELGSQVSSALKCLPADQREPIQLAFFQGLTHEQIAATLAVPLGTVKTRIRLGMARLRDRFSSSPSMGFVQ